LNCARLQQVLDAHIDGELDRATSGEIRAHLAGCAACAALHANRSALRDAVRAHAPRHAAPAALTTAIHRSLARAGKPPRAREIMAGHRPSWLHAAVFACVAALAGLMAGYWLAQPRPDHPLREPAVAAHVTALASGKQLIQIASTDRHTVKPWFQGKVDFAPPVKDLAGEGFVLSGGRLDQVADKPAAAIVYQIRQHTINLFVWRSTDRTPDAITATSERGFSVVTWAADGLRFAAVSDVDGRDLTRFARLMAAPVAAVVATCAPQAVSNPAQNSVIRAFMVTSK
jgi:anti-sigma factor RsiW